MSQGIQLDRIATLERQVSRLTMQLDRQYVAHAQLGEKRHVRLAKTVKVNGVYPNYGGVFGITFLNSVYTEVPDYVQGDLNLQDRASGHQGFIRTTGRWWLPEGTICLAYRVNRQWWTDERCPILWGTTLNSIPANFQSGGRVNLFRNGVNFGDRDVSSWTLTAIPVNRRVRVEPHLTGFVIVDQDCPAT